MRMFVYREIWQESELLDSNCSRILVEQVEQIGKKDLILKTFLMSLLNA